jgi:hypothetical protein
MYKIGFLFIVLCLSGCGAISWIRYGDLGAATVLPPEKAVFAHCPVCYGEYTYIHAYANVYVLQCEHGHEWKCANQ